MLKIDVDEIVYVFMIGCTILAWWLYNYDPDK